MVIIKALAEMLIREYQPSDATAVKQCLIELQDFERELDPRLLDGRLIADKYLKYMLARCREEAGKVFVVEVKNKVVGFVAVQSKVKSEDIDEEEYEYAYISDLAVLSNYRKRGLGRALLKAAESYGLSKGAKLIRIGVLAKNRAARRLYEDCEYQERQVVLEKVLTDPHDGAG